MTRPLLERLALYSGRHYRAVFLIVGLLVAAGVAMATRLEFDTDVLNLLPHDEPAVETYRKTLEEFGSLDFLVVAVRIPEGVVLEPYEEFVEFLGAELDEVDLLSEVEYSIGELEELIATFYPNALYFLDEEGLEGLESRLTDDALEQRAAELKRQLAMPQAITLKSLLLLDPLAISEVFFDRIETSTAGLRLDWTRGYFLSRDHRMLLALAQPIPPPQNVDLTRVMIDDVEAAVERAKSQWEAITGPDGPPVPEVELGGRHMVALGDASVIRGDFLVNIVTSMVGVLLLFLFAFRRFGPLAYAVVPLASGLAMTFGVSYLLYGGLSAATSGVAALLIGLGIDFVIVSYGRYVEEGQAGKSHEQALMRMSGSCGRAVVVGGVTSAATFYAFGVTDFTGLRQMGFLTGTGILLCMVAVLLLLPAMLTWSVGHHARRDSRPRLFLHGFGSGRLIRVCLRHPVPVLVAAGGLTAVAATLALQVRFEDSVRSMRPEGSPAVEFRAEIAERFGSGFEHMMLLIRGETADEVLKLADRTARRAEPLIAEGVLSGVESVSSVLPSPARQEQVLAWLEQARRDGLDPGRIRGRFEIALERQGVRSEPFDEGLDLFEQAMSIRQPIDIEELEEDPQSRRVLDRYLRHDADGWQSVVYLYTPAGTGRRGPPTEVVELASDMGPGVTLTGSNVVSAVLRESILEDATLGVAVGFLVVGFLLWLDYRRLSDTLLTLAPLGMGIIWMLAMMAVLDIAMNFMNIFVTTMIIGIGVDYGVHAIHRYREIRRRGHGRLDLELVETGKAIAMAAVSTMVGFGSLSLSHYPGLRSMGLVAILGALATCLVALTVLPAYLALRDRRWRAAGGPDGA